MERCSPPPTTSSLSDDEVESVVQKFQTWSDKRRVTAVKKMLHKMNHNQLSQINQALRPLLQRDFITLLPQGGLVHIAEMILSYLDADSLSKASAVCSEWNRIIQEGMLWKRLVERKVRSDPVWAGLVRRQSLDLKTEYRGKPVYEKMYFDIVRTIERLETKWREGNIATRKINCRSENSKGVYCIQYDDNKIVSGLRDNTIKIWNIDNLECTRTFQGHTGSVLCLQYDDNIIVSGSSDATVRVWDVNDLDSSQPLNTVIQHSEAVLHLKFKGRMMVTCSKDRSIIVWDMISPKNIKVLSSCLGHRAAVNVVDFDEKYIVSASGDRSIKVWDKETFSLVRTLNGHRRGIACLQYRDGLVVSGSSDNSIRIWDIETGACIRVLEGHEELVRCIRFDTKRIVSGAYDGKIKIWDLKAALDESSPDNTSFCLRTLHKHTGRVFRLQFDEFRIVSSSHDDTIIVWDFLSD